MALSMGALPSERKRWTILLVIFELLLRNSESFQAPRNLGHRQQRTSLLLPLDVYMFDPFQGASRYIVPSDDEDSESDGIRDGVVGRIGTPSSTKPAEQRASSRIETPSWTSSSLPSGGGSVYIGVGNETIASSHGLERNNLLRNEGLNLGSAVVGDSDGSFLKKGVVLDRDSATTESSLNSTSSQVLATMPSMSDLCNRLELLQKEIKTRNAQVQGTVDKLTSATSNVAHRLQTSTDTVHTIVSELKGKLNSAQKELRLKNETIERAQNDFKQLENSTSTAMQRLADQLQEYKIQSHATLVDVQKKAVTEQALLQHRIQELEEQLCCQQNLTESEKLKADDYANQRIAVERELESTRAALQANIKTLEGRIIQLEADRAEELERMESKQHQELDSLREQLEKVIAGLRSNEEALRHDLRTKELDYQRSLDLQREQSSEKEKTLNEKIQHFTMELEKVMKDSSERISAEQEKAKQYREELQDQIRLKEKELEFEAARAAALDTKVKDYHKRQQELENELAVLEKEHYRVIEDWQSRLKDLEEASKQERKTLEERLEESAVREESMKKNEEQHLATISRINEQIEQQKERTRKMMEEARYSAAQMQDDLKHQIKWKENELAEQIALNADMKEREQKHFDKISELGGELSALKNKFARETAIWESRYQTLQEEQSTERETANATIARVTSESAAKLAEIVHKAKLSQATLERQIQDKDLFITNLQVQQNNSIREMESLITLTKAELDRTKDEAESRRLREERIAAEELSKLRHRLDSTESSLMKEVQLREELELRNSKLIDLRVQVEGELSALKNKYARELALWEDRLSSLKEESSATQKEHLVQIKEKEAELQRLTAEHDSERKRQDAIQVAALKRKDSERLKMLQELDASFTLKEKQLQNQVKTLNMTIEKLKTDFDLQLTQEKEASKVRQNDLMSQISRKEEELRVQLRSLHEAKVAAEQARARQRSTHDEYQSLRSKYDALKLEWELKYKALEELRLQELTAAHTESRRLATEMQGKLDSATQQLKDKESEFGRCLRTMDTDHRQKISDLHRQYQIREKDLSNRIESEKAKLEEANKNAAAALESSQQTYETRITELNEVIKGKEELIGIHSKSIEEYKRSDFQQKQVIQRLEQNLIDLKEEHSRAISDWTERCSTLQKEMKMKVELYESQIDQKGKETMLLVEESKAKAEKIRTNLELAAKARDTIYEQKVRSLQTSLDSAERQLEKQVDQLRMSGDAAKKLHADLLQQFREKEKELVDQLAITQEQMAESERLRQSQAALELELDSLKQIQETTIADWVTKCNALEGSIIQLEEANVKAIAHKEAEWKERLDAAIDKMRSEKYELEKSFEYKEKSLNQKIVKLKEASSEKERELKNRIQAVTEEFQKYKFTSHQALMEAQQKAQDATESASHDQHNLHPGTLERIRFDLSKLLVRKEVEKMREAFISDLPQAPRGSRRQSSKKRRRFEIEPGKKEQRQKRKSFRERLASIFARSPSSSDESSKVTDDELIYRR